MAESNIPGRELRAIAWFGAYLTAHPTAQNAAVVKGTISQLKADHQHSLLGVIRSADAAARSLGVGVYLSRVAGAAATAGDVASALRTAGATAHGPSRATAYAAIAVAQAAAGDMAGATETVHLIDDPLDKHRAQTEIVGLQAAAGDIQGALRTWGSMAGLPKLSGAGPIMPSAASSIAVAQAKSSPRQRSHRSGPGQPWRHGRRQGHGGLDSQRIGDNVRAGRNRSGCGAAVRSDDRARLAAMPRRDRARQ
jgi:hypothetical protein